MGLFKELNIMSSPQLEHVFVYSPGKDRAVSRINTGDPGEQQTPFVTE